MEGDYLADDGIHHVRKQVVLNGTESLDVKNVTDENIHFSSGVLDSYGSSIVAMKCSHFQKSKDSLWTTDVEGFNIVENYYHLRFRINKQYLSDITTKEKAIDSFRMWLSINKPVVEFELVQEEIEPYTPEQKSQYEAIKKAMSYDEETNIEASCKNENVPFIIEAEAMSNDYEVRITALEKFALTQGAEI